MDLHVYFTFECQHSHWCWYGGLLKLPVKKEFLSHLENIPTLPPQNGDKPVRLLAKYSYKCNPSKPGGFDELTVTQGEKLELCRAHPSNPHWWEARNEHGAIGFVPATYMMVRSCWVVVSFLCYLIFIYPSLLFPLNHAFDLPFCPI